MSYPTPTGAFVSLLSSGQLSDPQIGWLCDNEVDTVAAITKFNMLVQTGALAGSWEHQVLLNIMAFFDAHAEAVAAPAAVYSGTAGAVSRYYAAVVRYPLVPVPGLGTSGATRFLKGKPPEGISPNMGLGAGQTLPSSEPPGGQNSGRNYRYSLLGARTTVASTAAALSANPANIVTITAPASSTVCTAAATTPTFDIVACDSSGNVLYWVGLGIAAGGTAVDNGATALLPYVKNVHAEAMVGPTSGLAVYAPPTYNQITSNY